MKKSIKVATLMVAAAMAICLISPSVGAASYLYRYYYAKASLTSGAMYLKIIADADLYYYYGTGNLYVYVDYTVQDYCPMGKTVRVEFKIGREFDITSRTSCYGANHITSAWHVTWFPYLAFGEMSTAFQINSYSWSFSFTAKRIDYKSSKTWSELGVEITLLAGTQSRSAACYDFKVINF